MKKGTFSLLVSVLLIAGGSCDKTENDYMSAIPEGLHLLRQVNTYYDDHVVVDTFYYNSDYKLSCLERREDSTVNRFYFENNKLKEQTITLKENGKQVSYSVDYLNDGTLAIANNKTAYIFGGVDSGYFTHLICYTHETFVGWAVQYNCTFEWENGNLYNTCYDKEMVSYLYDEKSNPLAGYILWGFFYDGYLAGTTNNRIENGYEYQYNEFGYPVFLQAPDFYREYYYYE